MNRVGIARQGLHFRRLFSKYVRNDQIYIHKNDHGVKYSLSPNPRSLPIGYSSSTMNDVKPDAFEVEPKFLDLLHNKISSSIQDDFSFVLEAGMNANAFMPIYDFRRIPEYARIPEVDNIFGYVQVNEQGKIIPGSYQSNNLYRLCNGTDGLIKLSDYLYSELQAECDKT